MKKILFLILLISSVASAQQTNHTPWMKWEGKNWFDKLVPRTDTNITPEHNDTGMIASIRKSDGTRISFVWVKISSQYKWDTLRSTGGSGTGVIPDTVRALNRMEIVKNAAELRALATTRLRTDIIYRYIENKIVGDFYWDPTSTMTDDSVMSIQRTGTATGRFLRYYEQEINADWFGPDKTAGTSASAKLQKAIDWVLRNKKGGTLFIPAGNYLITRGLFVGVDADSDGQWDFCGIKIRGVKNAYGGQGAIGAETTFYVTDTHNFGIAFQNNKGSELEGISFFGTNDAPGLVDGLTIADTAHATWVDSDCRDTSTSPLAAIVIDPFCRASAHAGTSWMYPSWIDHYTETFDNGSTDLHFKNLQIQQFVVGICNSPTAVKQNAEIMSYENIWVSQLKSAFTNGQSQARTCIYKNIHAWTKIEVVFDCQRYGDFGASGIYVEGLNCADFVKWLIACEDFGVGGLNVIRNCHAELTYGIGGTILDGHTGGNLKIEDSQLDLLGEVNGNTHRANIIFNGLDLILDHTKIVSYSQGDPSPYFAKCSNIQITNGSIAEIIPSLYFNNAGPNYVHHDPSWNEKRFGPVGYLNADVAAFGLMPLDQGFKFIINGKDQTYNGIGWTVEREYVGPPWVTVPIVVDSTHSLVSRTIILVVNPASISSVCLGSNLIGSFEDEVTHSNVPASFGYVSAINTSNNQVTVTFTNKAVPSNYSGTLFTYKRATVNLYPYFQIGNIVSGSNKIGGVIYERSSGNISENQYFCHPAFPFGTWVKSIVGDTITLSNNATYSQANAFIANFTQWKTTLLGGTSLMDTAIAAPGKFALQRGDQLRNMVPTSGANTDYDTSRAGAAVIQDGMTGTSGRNPHWVFIGNGSASGGGGGSSSETFHTLTDQDTILMDLDSGRIASVVLFGNREIDIENASAGDRVTLSVINGDSARRINLPGDTSVEFSYSDEVHGMTRLDGVYDGTWSWTSHQFGPVYVYEPEALNFFNVVTGLTDNQKHAVNDMLKDIKDSIGNVPQAIYPMIGGTSTSCKYNLMDARNVDAAFRLSFTGGWTFDSHGALPNGTSDFANTHFVFANSGGNIVDNNDWHVSFYSSTTVVPSSGDATFGKYSVGGDDMLWDYHSTDNVFIYTGNTINITASGLSDLKGLEVMNRSSSTSAKAFLRGSQIGSTATTAHTGASDTAPLYYGANNNNGTAEKFSHFKMEFGSIGAHLTDAEQVIFKRIIDRYIAAK